MTHAANNPFFGKFKTPFETPPFDKIKIEHYEPLPHQLANTTHAHL